MNLLGRFDGTGSGRDNHFLSADAHPFADFHHRAFGPEMAAGQFVGLRDTDDLAHPLEQFDIPRIEIRAHAHGAKHRVSFSGRAVHVESHGHQAVNHVLDLVVQSPFLHHNNHVTLLARHSRIPGNSPPTISSPRWITIPAASPFSRARHPDASLRLTPRRAASLSARTLSPTARAAASADAAFSISATSADPTTAASASPPSTETCPGSEIPKPTASGSDVTRRVRRTRSGKSSGSASLTPVTPVREIRYRNPVETPAIFARRSSGEVGAARKIVSSPCAAMVLRCSPDSSGVRSVINTPSAPAAAAVAENRSSPI